MNAISKVYKFLIARLVAWFHGLNGTDFDKVVEQAKELQKITPKLEGADKAARLRAWIAVGWTRLEPWAVNVLLELAVGYLRKTSGR